jgi:predicted Rossmann fold flavoprotein
MVSNYDVIIIGAGAAGLMAAIQAGKRGRRVLVIDHSKKIGEKIRISGGGRCNFTNLNCNASKFISNNPKFAISALKRFTQIDFINLIKKHNIKYHEKKLGQLFCDGSAKQIIDMLLLECEQNNVIISSNTQVDDIQREDKKYLVFNNEKKYISESIIIATGGLSIPKIGASGFGYDIAKKFKINVIETYPALVPLTFSDKLLSMCKELTGLSLESSISCNKIKFDEGMLFTHRGLSGPSILQISSYWKLNDMIEINLLPAINLFNYLTDKKVTNPKANINNLISEILPKRLASILCTNNNLNMNISEIPDSLLKKFSNTINAWTIKPVGSEGYRTAEVTRGGVDTKELSSKTMMSNSHPGLFFIGEVVDVTGHLGGYNFQWAWSSGYVAGQFA